MNIIRQVEYKGHGLVDNLLREKLIYICYTTIPLSKLKTWGSPNTRKIAKNLGQSYYKCVYQLNLKRQRMKE